jgi:outer membrane protein assembly factor BamA
LTSRLRIGFLLFIVAMLFLEACNVTKPLKENEYLLVKNKFRINTSKVSSEELSGYLQQKPNKKLFGLFRANIAFYNLGSKGKDTKFKKWMRTKVGSPPVLLDTTLAAISAKQMKLYLDNKGYFGSVIHDSISYKKKKVKAHYLVRTTRPYTIRRISYAIADTQLARFVYADTAKSLIKRGRNYDVYELENERLRITESLLNNGYYRFSTSFIFFRIDSSLATRQMDLTIEITNPVVPSLEMFGTFTETDHNRYFINKIYIDPEFDLMGADTARYDTIVKTYRGSRKDTAGINYYFLSRDKFHVKPRTIVQSVTILPGNNFNRTEVQKSYSLLSALGVFKYVNIHFEDPREKIPAGKDLLDCRIQLARTPVQSFSISTDGTNSGGALGVQASFTYQNRNIFRGAQLFRLSFTASAQMQGSIGSSSDNSLFNTLEFGVNAGLTFPQFLFPIKPEFLSKNLKPKTTVAIGYNFQRRTDYDRHILNASFGYNWVQNEKIRHTINPVEILSVKVFQDSSFKAYLDSLTDKRLKNQYVDHLVAGLKYTFTFSNQDVSKVKDFFYIRSNFEMGGNLIYLVDKIIGAEVSGDGVYTVFNLPYAQYVRPDLDFRFYQLFSNKTSMVYRFYGGIGIPYGNTQALPFEKAFFAGGANDIRGWRMGSLGPGSYHNDTLSESYDQTGDMQLQVNLEYRFPVYKMIKSAVFLDAGNVWLLRETADLPGGKFSFSTFLPQVAINVGFGIRADFDFFIIRLDPAVPIRVPYYDENNHWFFGKIQIRDIIWNFGIGYPF